MIARRLMIGTLLSLVAGMIVGICAHRVEARKRPALEYGIAECTSWPFTDGQAITADLTQKTMVITAKGRRVLFWLPLRGIFASMEGRKMGATGGKTVWSVRGPVKLRAALQAAGCSVIRYSDAMTLGAAKKAWVKARSTCVGKATRKGKTIKVWPCGQAGTTEVRLDGLAPLVLYGGNAFTAAGVEP